MSLVDMVESIVRFSTPMATRRWRVSGLDSPEESAFFIMLHHAADEVLLALDPREVRGGVIGPAAGLEGFEVPAADVGQCLEAVELDASGPGEVQTALLVAGRGIE